MAAMMPNKCYACKTSPAVVERTRRRWFALCHSLHVADDAAEAWWRELRDSYEGPGRFYHTLEHVDAMLTLAFDARDALDDAEAVELATFFHDVVYDAKHGGGGANERRSAERFAAFAREAVNPVAFSAPRRERVVRWIELTFAHRCGADAGGDCRLFMDFDMAILAADRPTYLRYAANVRREYAHVSGVGWRFGRSRFLASAASPAHTVFSSDRFAAREADARRNAAAEKWRLRAELAAQVACAAAAAAAAARYCLAP